LRTRFSRIPNLTEMEVMPYASTTTCSTSCSDTFKDQFRDRIAGHWAKYRGLAQPT
jgi:hypothetical protein